MNAESLRLFIAIELNDALRGELKRAQKQLQDECSRSLVAQNAVRWVAPQNSHLTLKFLGNSKRTQIPLLQDALAQVTARFAPFELTARGLGCFPNTRRPNNIWVGLEGEVQTAALLARQIEEQSARLNFARDKYGFTPHLTLGRVKREASQDERATLGNIVKNFPATTFGTIHADAVHLIASDLQPSGPIYTILSESKLSEESGK